MVKKFLESKNAELLLAAQVIDSSEDARMKRPSQRLNEQPTTPKKKISHKYHKLDVTKLAVREKEKNKRLARKKLRRSENSVLNSGNFRPRGSEGEPSSDYSKATSSHTQATSEQRVKRVSFA
ncbi:hypothetical protein FRC11_007319 [Ceratobasidium sp. 423]|nr:hypothetical protein FRC11_007319 [Ceratobasidium sp. 423]